MKNMVQAFLVEAKWFHGKYIPTIEEYMRDALVSSGATVFAIISFIVMGEIATKEVFDWVQQNPKIVRALSTVMRLMNDMATHKVQ